MHWAIRKNKELSKEKDSWQKKAKILRFLVSKGYESDLAQDAVDQLTSIEQ